MNAKTTIMAGAMLAAMATLGAGQSKNADKELTVADLRAQQPDEAIRASAQCISARENADKPGSPIIRHHTIDPQTLSQSLSDLMRNSDEVILAGVQLHHAELLSPTGDTAVTYYDVKVIRTWKGSHNVGDVVTFGVPAGRVNCGRSESGHAVYFPTIAWDADWKNMVLGQPKVLFLRRPRGEETRIAQSLIPTGGGGLQGVYPIHISPTEEAEPKCTGVLPGTLKWCDSFLEVSQLPVRFPFSHDPIAKRYDGMPAHEFLDQVRETAADQGLDEKSANTQ